MHVGDRLVLGVEVEQDADVPELERAVDEAGALAELRSAAATARLTASVVRPTPPLGPNTAIDAAGLAGPRRPSLGWAPRRRVAPPEADRGRLVARSGTACPARGCRHGRMDEVARSDGEGLDEELAGAGQHGPAEGSRPRPGRTSSRRRRWAPRAARRSVGGDAVHVRHVDVHQDDVGRQRRRRRRGLRRPEAADPDDLDVRSRSRGRSCREVIAGLPGCRRR